jgi:hypothetical protein
MLACLAPKLCLGVTTSQALLGVTTSSRACKVSIPKPRAWEQGKKEQQSAEYASGYDIKQSLKNKHSNAECIRIYTEFASI